MKKTGASVEKGSPTEQDQPKRHRVEVEFLFLDREICRRCRGTEESLEEALSELRPVLEATGVELSFRKIHVKSEAQARKLWFVSSPTIRINDRDLQPEVHESPCESCGDLCGEQIDCRVWRYWGREFSVPPKGMLIEAILQEVYAGPPVPPVAEPGPPQVPDNLQRFFAGRSAGTSSACCDEG